jgi:sec-independent protein translocase protein TatA
MGSIQPWHLIVIAAVAFLLFGAKKLPDATRSVGQSMRIFKSEMRQAVDDAKDPAAGADAVKAEDRAP